MTYIKIFFINCHTTNNFIKCIFVFHYANNRVVKNKV